MKKIIIAVLIIIMCLALFSCEKSKAVETEDDDLDGVVLAVPVNGKNYVISIYGDEEDELPEGFEYAGTVESGVYEGCEYYTDENEPYWIYVKSWVGIAEKSEKGYFRFVDSEIYGKNYISYNGNLYVEGWDKIYWNRIEGELPEGFESAGRAEFSGYDTVPEGKLSSNTGSEEVFVNKNDDSVVFVRTTRFGSGNERFKGFTVYIKAE